MARFEGLLNLTDQELMLALCVREENLVNPSKWCAEMRQYMQKSFERQRLLNKVLAQPGPFPYVLILDHLKVDFNIGKIIRSALCSL